MVSMPWVHPAAALSCEWWLICTPAVGSAVFEAELVLLRCLGWQCHSSGHPLYASPLPAVSPLLSCKFSFLLAAPSLLPPPVALCTSCCFHARSTFLEQPALLGCCVEHCRVQPGLCCVQITRGSQQSAAGCSQLPASCPALCRADGFPNTTEKPSWNRGAFVPCLEQGSWGRGRILFHHHDVGLVTFSSSSSRVQQSF